MRAHSIRDSVYARIEQAKFPERVVVPRMGQLPLPKLLLRISPCRPSLERRNQQHFKLHPVNLLVVESKSDEIGSRSARSSWHAYCTSLHSSYLLYSTVLHGIHILDR